MTSTIACAVGLAGCADRDDAWRDACGESPARLQECVMQDPDVRAWASWAERRLARHEAELTARVEQETAAHVRAYEAAGQLIEGAGRTGERLPEALSLCRNERLRGALKVQCDRMYRAVVARRKPALERDEAVHALCSDIGEVRRLVRERREETIQRLCEGPWSAE